MSGVQLPRVLCVDDEREILEGIKVTLRKRYSVSTASSGAEGLARLRNEASFEVVISDMRMPALDGVGFLTRARELSPTTIRILLTGVADLNAVIHVVNDGQIFRVLTKPCPPRQLLATLKEAVSQHRLQTSEKVLLEQTLRGAIGTLTHLLSIANPAAFGRASRVRRVVRALGDRMGAANVWQLEVAAMLSQIGCVTLAPETARKLYFGEPLDLAEQRTVSHLPTVANELLRDIPRIDEIRLAILLQDRRFDGAGTHPDDFAAEELPLAARLLKLANDYDELEGQGLDAQQILKSLRARAGAYDPKALDALGDAVERSFLVGASREVSLSELRPGMVLEQDVVLRNGILLVARGNDVTPQLIAHLRNYAAQQLPPQLKVVIPEAD